MFNAYQAAHEPSKWKLRTWDNAMMRFRTDLWDWVMHGCLIHCSMDGLLGTGTQ